MKRSFSKFGLAAAGTSLIAVTYGLVRLAYGLVLPDVQADLHLGTVAAGWISSGASLLYCVGASVGFFVAARVPRTLVVLAAGTAAVGAAGVALSPTAALFGASAVLASAGAGLASPALVQIVARSMASADARRVQTIVNAGTGPGLVVAALLAVVLLPDWRAAWAISAVCAVLAGIAVLGTDHGGTRSSAVTVTLPPGAWFRRHRGLLAAALLLGAGSAPVWNLGRTVLVDAGVGRTVSVVAWIALGIGGAAVVTTARWLDARSAPAAWSITVMAVAVATVGIGVGAGSVPVALVMCAVFGWGYTAATGALIAWTTDLDPDHAPAGTSMLFVTLVLGQAAGAAVAGSVLTAVGPAGTMVAGAVVAVLGVAAAGLGGVRRTVGAVRQDGPS
ncbi:MFS transporter [Curtobacterium sp. MCBA15_001]|uniref:MFS transporter n=1 Tax=Curtobacterium sp. MCBA15_001 TaxID=1898731 RepID=UPI000A76AD25|nr:MFS transporter [Curtobacterium sp. MCBA15_001]